MTVLNAELDQFVRARLDELDDRQLACVLRRKLPEWDEGMVRVVASNWSNHPEFRAEWLDSEAVSG